MKKIVFVVACVSSFFATNITHTGDVLWCVGGFTCCVMGYACHDLCPDRPEGQKLLDMYNQGYQEGSKAHAHRKGTQVNAHQKDRFEDMWNRGLSGICIGAERVAVRVVLIG